MNDNDSPYAFWGPAAQGRQGFGVLSSARMQGRTCLSPCRREAEFPLRPPAAGYRQRLISGRTLVEDPSIAVGRSWKTWRAVDPPSGTESRHFGARQALGRCFRDPPTRDESDLPRPLAIFHRAEDTVLVIFRRPADHAHDGGSAAAAVAPRQGREGPVGTHVRRPPPGEEEDAGRTASARQPAAVDPVYRPPPGGSRGRTTAPMPIARTGRTRCG